MPLCQECFWGLSQFYIRGSCYRETCPWDCNWGLWGSAFLNNTSSTIAINLSHFFRKELLWLCIPGGGSECVLRGALLRRLFYFSEPWVYVSAGELNEILVGVNLLFLALLFLVLHRSYSLFDIEYTIEYILNIPFRFDGDCLNLWCAKPNNPGQNTDSGGNVRNKVQGSNEFINSSLAYWLPTEVFTSRGTHNSSGTQAHWAQERWELSHGSKTAQNSISVKGQHLEWEAEIEIEKYESYQRKQSTKTKFEAKYCLGENVSGTGQALNIKLSSWKGEYWVRSWNKDSNRCGYRVV